MINQQTKIQLYKLLGSLRPDWQDAGIHDACTDLAGQPGTPFELVAQAVGQARVAANRTPECITWPLPGTPPRDLPAAIPTPTPDSLTVWCNDHGANAKVRTDGSKHCCWLEEQQAKERRELPPIFTRTPAPENFRDLVAAARASRDDQGDETNG